MHRRVYRCLVPIVAIAALGLAGCATRALLPPVAVPLPEPPMDMGGLDF